MDIEDKLKRRFSQAIRRSYDPCPLIGPKWFQYNPDGKPAHFQFVGGKKLAKAASGSPRMALRRVLKNLNVRDLNARAEIVGQEIHVHIEGPPPREKAQT
jgi:hypothetical protein